MTDNGGRSYWRVALTTLEDGGLAINTSKIGAKTPLGPLQIPIWKSNKDLRIRHKFFNSEPEKCQVTHGAEKCARSGPG